jgi:hypothetical protein
MITFKEIFINLLFGAAAYYTSKNIWITLLFVVTLIIVVRFSYRFFRAHSLANKIIKQAKGGEICFGLKQACHPLYQANQEKCGGMAPYIAGLGRYPTQNDLFSALLAVLYHRMITNNNCLYKYIIPRPK